MNTSKWGEVGVETERAEGRRSARTAQHAATGGGGATKKEDWRGKEEKENSEREGSGRTARSTEKVLRVLKGGERGSEKRRYGRGRGRRSKATRSTQERRDDPGTRRRKKKANKKKQRVDTDTHPHTSTHSEMEDGGGRKHLFSFFNSFA